MNNMDVQIYEYRVYFEGNRLQEDDEPPANFFQTLLETITKAMLIKEDVINHECITECALSNYVVIGFPYAENLEDAVPRYAIKT